VVEPAAVRLAAERATAADLEDVTAAYEGMKKAIEEGGDYVTHDMHFHTGMLVASHNRMIVQMSKALGALLRTSFEISTTRKDAPKASLPLHKAVLDAVVAQNPDKAEKAIRVLIEGAHQDMEHVLTSRRKLPSLSGPAKFIKAS
jgi:DNA-binding FadR family transcriptional regulator